ncbi:MAG: hypothetical protein JXP73_02455 [Deltaproteobacteria bacterium]|nr:hypothetical protein [Deltaproteobacteria bacterium]
MRQREEGKASLRTVAGRRAAVYYRAIDSNGSPSELRSRPTALPGGLSRRFVVLALALLLFGGSLLLYAPCVGFGFVGHDFSAGQHSIPDLPPNVALPLGAADIAVIVVTLLGSACLLWLALGRRKDLGFFVFAFFVFMAPYAKLEYMGLRVADRYAYPSSLCIVALLVGAGLEAWRSRRRLLRAAAALLFALLVLVAGHNLWAGRAHRQAFRDARAFWEYELGRARPSMLAFESSAKTALAEAAAAKTGSPERKQAVLRVARLAVRGLRYYQSLPWRPAAGYFSRERAHAAGLYTALGLAAGLVGHPLEEQLGYHHSAYELTPNPHTALMVAQTMLDMARREPPNEALARDSLFYFGRYLREAKSDPLLGRGLPELLRRYTGAFPGLSDEVARVARESLR